MTPLKPITGSSQVTAAGYDAASRVLAVQFKNSAFVYSYKDVPPELAAEFEASESKGTFIAAQIKGKFEFDKVDTASTEDA